MNGFDSYSPLKWIVDGAFAVHVAEPFARAVKDASARRGRWAAKAIAAASIGAAVALGISAPQAISSELPTATSVVRFSQLSLDLPAPQVEGATPADRRIAELKAGLQGLKSQLRRGIYHGSPELTQLADSAAATSNTALPSDWSKRLARGLIPA